MYCEVSTRKAAKTRRRNLWQKFVEKAPIRVQQGGGSGCGGCGAGRCGVSHGATSDLYGPSDAEKPTVFHT